MDKVFNYTYKNAEYEVIVEEDAITTGKIYIDNERVATYTEDYSLENDVDVPFNKANLEAVKDRLKEIIDVHFYAELALMKENYERKYGSIE